jgi:type I restriction enzyme M protein
MRKASYIEDLHDLFMPLTPGHYVGIEDDGIPFAEKMEKFSSNLYDFMQLSNELDEEIQNNLKGLGYDQ